MSEIALDVPLIKTQVIEYNRFKIKNFDLKLNDRVSIIILLYPVNPEHVVECRTIVIDGAEYQNWGSDDSYIIQAIKNKISNE